MDTTSPTRISLSTDHFSLRKIERSGQAFRWVADEDGYTIPAFGKLYHVSERNGLIDIEGDNSPCMVHYLALDEDYAAFISRMASLGSPEMDAMLVCGDGIRVLHQDPWETAVTFVISQNNNIPRIRRCVTRVCGGELEPFPTPDELLHRLDCGECGLGYRKSYLESLCRVWPELSPTLLEPDRTLAQDMALLQQQPGIGPKVAACICLFGLGHADAFPVDTWMRKAQAAFDIPVIPEIAGIQQQFIFNFIRNET